MSACSSVPLQSVTRANVALASGFPATSMGTLRQASHATTAAASAISATHGSHFNQAFAGAARAPCTSGVAGSTSCIAAISIRASPISLRRCFGSFARQRSRSRRIGAGVAAGNADQSGSRSRIFAIESDIVSPANVTRPASIS